ncbi:MAG: NAD(P)/FAD-dependent oxidoreductase [Lachnospiraceae bacterium]|nr:NAD(P)/FAD-dependent oxidoreductase [Lachnospiraceae bacterium]MBQ6469628.1 NAD(P)/FAD-dependent oxidoreductase [Lachnospiraceae bacterium]
MSERAVVIGGGAAGMFASIQLAKRGMDVMVLEKNEKLGKKVFITGKGRCNFTNVCDEETFFRSVMRNPKFLYSAYHAFRAQDTVEFFENAGMPVKVERGRRAFPVSDHAYDVTDALKRLMKRYGVNVLLNTEAVRIETGGEKQVTGVYFRSKEKNTDSQEEMGYAAAERVIIATGGLSYPSTGSTGDGYRFARETGHTVTDCTPSLVPLLTEENVSELAGLSLKNVTLTILKPKKMSSEIGEMLFTHKGISGPLVLTASSILAGEKCTFPVGAEIDLKPGITEEELDRRIVRLFEEHGAKNLSNLLRELFPVSMINWMIRLCGLDGTEKGRDVTRKERNILVRMTKHFPLMITGNAGYAEAVITKGGVSVKEIDPKTMMSKKIKGLYFTGEVIDTDALTGGFNLQIAWSTAFAAGNAPD